MHGSLLLDEPSKAMSHKSVFSCHMHITTGHSEQENPSDVKIYDGTIYIIS